MAHYVQDDGELCVDTERVDLNQLCTGATIDLDSLCVTGVIEEEDLCTDIGEVVNPPVRYRADTTLLTADNSSITADYSY